MWNLPAAARSLDLREQPHAMRFMCQLQQRALRRADA
jgi:hypothetical protein